MQDYNNLKGERSLSSQDVSQRLIISYVLDLPFGHGKKFLVEAPRERSTKLLGDGESMASRAFNAVSR